MGEDTAEAGFSSNGRHGDVIDHMTSFPLDNAGLADIRTDEDVEMKPGDGTQVTYRKGKGAKKYKKSLKKLVPFRPKPKAEPFVPLDHSGLFSFLTLSWMTPIFKKAVKRPLELADFFTMSENDSGDLNGQRFQALWEEELKKKGKEKASLKRVCLRFVRTRHLISIFFLIMSVSCVFVTTAVLVQRLLEYTEADEQNLGYGLAIVFCILALNILRVVCDVTYWSMSFRTATRLRGGILSMMFKKIARLRSLQDRTVGEVGTLNFGSCSNRKPLNFVFVHRVRRKGLVCCAMHVKEPSYIYCPGVSGSGL